MQKNIGCTNVAEFEAIRCGECNTLIGVFLKTGNNTNVPGIYCHFCASNLADLVDTISFCSPNGIQGRIKNVPGSQDLIRAITTEENLQHQLSQRQLIIKWCKEQKDAVQLEKIRKLQNK